MRRRNEYGELADAFNRMAADLEAVDRHRKELVANVSHELRTPIAALRAVLENVVDGVYEADSETLQTALRQSERLGRLVATLLDLSRLDGGIVPLRARRFEVWPYLSDVLREANMSKKQGHARTDVHLDLDVWPLEMTAYADTERLHQVVANLIDNAVKHSPAHGKVTLRARAGEAPQSMRIEVQDEGPGIPEAERLGVFERFNRAQAQGQAQGGRRGHRARAGHRPLGGRPARRKHPGGRIRSRLPDPGHSPGATLPHGVDIGSSSTGAGDASAPAAVPVLAIRMGVSRQNTARNQVLSVTYATTTPSGLQPGP